MTAFSSLDERQSPHVILQPFWVFLTQCPRVRKLSQSPRNRGGTLSSQPSPDAARSKQEDETTNSWRRRRNLLLMMVWQFNFQTMTETVTSTSESEVLIAFNFGSWRRRLADQGVLPSLSPPLSCFFDCSRYNSPLPLQLSWVGRHFLHLGKC